MLRLLIIFVFLGFSGCAIAGPMPPTQESLPTLPGPTASVPPTNVLSQTATPPSTQVPTQQPSATLTPALAVTQTKSFSDPSLAISYSYPANWAILQRPADSPSGVSLHGPPVGEGPEPIIFAISIEVAPVSEESVDQVVDQQLQQVPSDLHAGLETRVVTVGGEKGVEIIGLPSRSGAIETFILHKGRLYDIILQPFDQDNPSLWPYLANARAIYQRLLESLRFLS